MIFGNTSSSHTLNALFVLFLVNAPTLFAIHETEAFSMFRLDLGETSSKNAVNDTNSAYNKGTVALEHTIHSRSDIQTFWPDQLLGLRRWSTKYCARFLLSSWKSKKSEYSHETRSDHHESKRNSNWSENNQLVRKVIIIVAVIVGVLLLIIVIWVFLCLRRRKKRKAKQGAEESGESKDEESKAFVQEQNSFGLCQNMAFPTEQPAGSFPVGTRPLPGNGAPNLHNNPYY